MHGIALLLVSITALGQAAAVKVCVPDNSSRCAGVEKLSDGGWGIDVVIAGGSSGSSGGGLTNAELRATPVPIGFDGGAVTSYQGGTWSGVGVTGPLTDAQLRASAPSVDVNDRAARLLGKADVLVGAAAPSATNPLAVRLTDGTTFYIGFKAGDVIGALPAGSALIGAVKFSQTTTDNDVDVTSLPAVMTDRSQKTQLTDGTRDGTIKAASTAAAAADTSVVVGLSPNSPIPTGANVIGAITQSGNWTARLVGNAGAALDSANNAAAPANVVATGIETVAAGSTPTAATAGNMRRQTGDLNGNTYVTGPARWTCNLQALAASLTQCQAAPAAGNSLYITSVIATTTTTTAGTFALRQGTGSNCATSPIGVWPQPGGSSPSRVTTAPISTALPLVMNFPDGLKLTAANALCVIGVATNTIDIAIAGNTGP